MFWFILGFGVGFYACYLVKCIKETRNKKRQKVDISTDKKVDEKQNKKDEVR